VTPSPAASAIERSTLDIYVAFCFLTLLAGNNPGSPAKPAPGGTSALEGGSDAGMHRSGN
jgi:hypothetical protein